MMKFQSTQLLLSQHHTDNREGSGGSISKNSNGRISALYIVKLRLENDFV